MRRALLLVLMLGITSAPVTELAAQDFIVPESDPDLQLLDRHFALHLGGSIGAGTVAVGALAVGIQALVLAGEEASPRAAQSRFVLGLTLVSMGVGTLSSSIAGIERSVRGWKSVRRQFRGASEAQRRLLRAQEARRLHALASGRALSLVANGSFLAIGIVLMSLEASDLGLPLVLDGAFALGIDIFRVVVDHQSALKWQGLEQESERGYFSFGPLLIAPPLPVAMAGPRGEGPGMGLLLSGAF